MDILWQPSLPWIHFVIRASVVYLAILLLMRLAGKRQVGQMGAGEFTAILLISNAVQNSMNGGDNSITGGLILATVIVTLSYLISYLTFRSKPLEHLIQGHPTILIHKGIILKANLKSEHLTHEDLLIALRKQGVHEIKDIETAILESDGSVSLIRTSEITRTSPHSA